MRYLLPLLAVLAVGCSGDTILLQTGSGSNSLCPTDSYCIDTIEEVADTANYRADWQAEATMYVDTQYIEDKA